MWLLVEPGWLVRAGCVAGGGAGVVSAGRPAAGACAAA